MKGVSTTGTWALGSTSMTVASATGITVGQYLQVTGIPVGAQVTGIVGTTVSWTSTLPAVQPALTASTVAFVSPMLVSDMRQGVIDLLMGRTVPNAKIDEATRKTVMEYTQSYKFTELQETGPFVQFIPGLSNYVPNFFMSPGSALLKLNKVDSFFLFTDPYVAPSSAAYTGNNAGYELVFKTIDRMEVLINTSGYPQNWTRHDGYLWFGCNPDQSYYTYMRYRREHPFPNAGTVNAGNDPLFMPDEWQETIEHGSAARLAGTYNLSSKESELIARLKGDEKFQRSGGIEGTPGMIFGLTSDEQRDQTTTVKRFRLRMGMR